MDITNSSDKKQRSGHKDAHWTWKNKWTKWELSQRHRKYKIVPNINHNSWTENTLEGFNSTLNEVEERTSELEDRIVWLTQTEPHKEKRIFKSEENVRDLWDNIKQDNICMIGGPEEEEERERDRKITWKKRGWKFP